MWRTAAQLRKRKEVRRSLYGTSATTEASQRSTEEYTSLDDSISVTPDTDDTSYETTSQYEVMEDDVLLSESVQRKNKAMFHMEHLRHELTRWFTTTQKHRKTRKNNYRHRTNQRSPTMRRKSSTSSRTPIRRKRSPQKVKTTRKGMVPHEKILTTVIQHPSSSTITAKAATPQQPNPPPMPPPDYDPPYSDGHNHTHLRGSNTDIKILRAKIPFQYVNTLDHIQQKLRSMLGMHEVTAVPNGPDINLQLKGTAKALHDAQERLGRMIDLNIFEEKDRVQHTRTTDAIPAQPPLPEHGTSGTPDKPADAAADATTPPDYNTREATKEGEGEKESPAGKHGKSTTIHLTKPIATKIEVVKGIMKTNDKTFGFIKVEDGTDMFVMPSACANFGHQLPAVGTKVTFRTAIDAKTNRIRAEAVG